MSPRRRRRAPIRRLCGQGLAFGEQQPGGAVGVVTATARPTGGITRAAFDEPPTPVLRPLFPLFYLVEIRHPRPYPMMSRPPAGARML
jgi:hypothetical protein